jgi:predicted nuclease of predicted toxin-antitoxin system
MRFLADMGVSTRVVEWLRNNGHDAKHLREEGLHRMPNGEIFTKAIHEDRIIITFDLDFGEIVALSKGKRASVILFRLHNTRTSHLLDRLSAVLKDSARSLEEGAVIVVEESRHRVRYLPPGARN